MFGRHTSENFTKLLVKLLSSLFPPWPKKLLGVSTDGEPLNTGRVGGIVTKLFRKLELPGIRVWCAPHQLDMVVKKVISDIDGGDWVKPTYSLTVYLRAQQSLVLEMGERCPKQTNR